MIEIKNLKKLWEDDGSSVLEGINLTIEDGDIYALVGRSGAGKSTLLRCINGLTSYQEGSLKVDGCEIKDLKDKELREFRRHVGMIFQQFSLLERETVYKNVALPMQCWKYPKDQIDKKVKELLELVGLGDKMNAKPRNLSGGQKQRVAVARALTMDPKILLCDEATSALDPKTTNSILDLLMEINQKLGITVIIVTHQMEVVRKACNKACILENGKIADEGSVKEIFIKQPQSLKRLLGEEQVKLPKEGHNIQIAHLVNDMHDGELFAKMSAELNYIFPIIDGKIQDYQNDSMGIFTINVDDEHLKLVTDYLTKEGLNWHEIEEQHDETKEDEE
ncbi:methionine ABC transporter ATP-binding protein [Dorea formicigenerans]|uniref:ATP-binding cassette domain-containing protein n=1 Tax=Dorea formicigenerans TaxID=39486 RepID=A0A3E4FAE8_9FIRM|nr:methionine ABC transporter ATP-binding protein [Dorea formicigenerans]RGI86735.1 ATP-binding cassette domain-containing protein [Dorea formicigenerans]RGI89911.1 ATP-binding cassette domain-containing protein [Dorea formicigenerans]RHC05183.1 ATP-binding cassette domain-containing protein [Dorea formicigenerans]RHC20082.1 ATP-binding cassette domain-containing protein [Dorea formicigenerans]VUX23335.1 Methionine import ATP-binding protein MetN [Dorea formicigenerans]